MGADEVEYHWRDFDYDEWRAEVEAQGLCPTAAPAGAPAPTPASPPPRDEAAAWEAFHVQHSRVHFFKERRYLLAEFPDLKACSTAGGEQSSDEVEQPAEPMGIAGATPVHSVLEIGCGSGSSILPILKANPTVQGYVCDFSAQAVAASLKTVEDAGIDLERCVGFVCDVTTEQVSLCGSSSAGLGAGPGPCSGAEAAGPAAPGLPLPGPRDPPEDDPWGWLWKWFAGACSIQRGTDDTEGEWDEPASTLEVAGAGAEAGRGGARGGVVERTVVQEVKRAAVQEVDRVVLVFVLSAVAPAHALQFMRHALQPLAQGGDVLFRDYAKYDLPMLRFPAAQRLAENVYTRQDGTLARFFTKEDLEALCSALGLVLVECEYCCVQLKNRKNGRLMRRVFIHARMRKPRRQ